MVLLIVQREIVRHCHLNRCSLEIRVTPVTVELMVAITMYNKWRYINALITSAAMQMFGANSFRLIEDSIVAFMHQCH